MSGSRRRADVWVFAPSGDLLGKVRVPELASNLHWGGEDWRTLFITATHSVYAVKTRIGPRLEPFMRPRGAGHAAPKVERPSAIRTGGAAVRSAADIGDASFASIRGAAR